MHSYYDESSPSGENVVVGNQLRALERAGHEVRLFSARTSEQRHEPWYRTRSALRVASGVGRRPASVLEFEPDIVHVHNLFPNFGRRWVGDLPVPVVATLHNYRPLCANAHLLLDGSVCTRCPDGAPLSSLRYACYRGSRLATAPLTVATWSASKRDPILTEATRLLVMSASMARVYERAGVPAGRMSVMPNFLPDALLPSRDGREASSETWLFVGRLSPEKGILDLVRAWPADRRLTIVGDGPQRSLVEEAARGKTVELLGSLEREAVLDLMCRSIGLVFPSRWLEGSPLVYFEALACGLPVLAWEPNVLADLVVAEGTGHAVRWESDIDEVLDTAEGVFPGLRDSCRAAFDERYSEPAFIARTERVYAEVTGA